jgi:hypothetical protein
LRGLKRGVSNGPKRSLHSTRLGMGLDSPSRKWCRYVSVNASWLIPLSAIISSVVQPFCALPPLPKMLSKSVNAFSYTPTTLSPGAHISSTSRSQTRPPSPTLPLTRGWSERPQACRSSRAATSDSTTRRLYCSGAVSVRSCGAREFAITMPRDLGRGRGTGEREGKKERWRRVLERHRADAACCGASAIVRVRNGQNGQTGQNGI